MLLHLCKISPSFKICFKKNIVLILHLFRYIILYIKRFTKNNFFVEKNPTIVNFPLSHIEFGDLLSEDVKDKHGDGTTYDLIANVVHDGSPEKGSYRVSDSFIFNLKRESRIIDVQELKMFVKKKL